MDKLIEPQTGEATSAVLRSPEPDRMASTKLTTTQIYDKRRRTTIESASHEVPL